MYALTPSVWTNEPCQLQHPVTLPILVLNQYPTAYGSAADAVGDGTQKRWATYASDAAIHIQSTAAILLGSSAW
jgi:hypothetical protein